MIKLKEINEIINGELIGDGETVISDISSINKAKKGEITFLINKNYEKYLDECQASAIIVDSSLASDKLKNRNIILTKNPALSYIKVANIFNIVKKKETGISHLASISKSARIATTASISPFVFIGDDAVVGERVTLFPFVHIGDGTIIGDDSIVYPNVTIYDRTEIGKRVIIHGGTVIGSDGFGYIWDGEKHQKIPQLGTVLIEDDVEIGANVTIDRATLETTVIKKGTKIDNLVQIAHNVSIGENSIIVAQVGIAGSSTIGKNVILAGQVGVRDHVTIGDNTRAGGQTGITKDVKAGSIVSGTPHMPHKDWIKLQIYLKKLPELFERIKEIENKIITEGNND